MGMFDYMIVNHPLPLPLEVVDLLPDIYMVNFQTKSFESGMDLYWLEESGGLRREHCEYIWIDDDSTLLKGYMKAVDKKVVDYLHHGIVEFYCYETIYFNEEKTTGIDISLEYSAKFTDGKLVNIELTRFKVESANQRIADINQLFDSMEEKANYWYNKYIFNTGPFKFFKKYCLLKPIHKIKSSLDKLYWFIQRNV